MAKKMKYKIPMLTLFGIIAMLVFWNLFGFMMLIKSLLGAVLFATVTIGLISFLNKRYKGRYIRL